MRQHTFELRAKGYITAVSYVTPSEELGRQVDIRLKPVPAKGKQDNITVERTAKSGMDMILIQPASFQIGASRREPGRRANERLRKIQITRPYYLAEKEVTNGEFKRFNPGHSSGVIGGYSLEDDKQPVVNISRDDAVRYLNWLSEQDGLEPFYREEDNKMIPTYNPATMESNIEGFYLAGVVCGGKETHKWFIENSRIHAKLISEHIESLK